MNRWVPTNLRTRLTVWYVAVLAILLVVYAALVLTFQCAMLARQIVHDEIQDVVTVEGLLYFDSSGRLQLRQDYYSRPQSHLLVDRLMEVRDVSGAVLYTSPTLHGMSLGGPLRPGEGDAGFNERLLRLNSGVHALVISHFHGMDGRQLVIRLGYSVAPLQARLLQFVLVLVISIPIAVLLAGVAGQRVARRALRPIERMTAKAEVITASNLHDRLEVANPADELGHLALVFNHLLDRLEQSFVQLQRFTADAAHELRTPIAALRTIGEVALKNGADGSSHQEALSSILEETSRLNQTIDALLLLAKAEAMHGNDPERTWPVDQLVEEVLAILEVLVEEKGMTVMRSGDVSHHACVASDRSLLRTALMNVIHNAVKFSPPCSVLRVEYTINTELPATVQLAIEDEGPGIPLAEQSRVFERFYTSTMRSTAGQSGTGLGLAVAQLIIKRLGGDVRFDPEFQHGARCLIQLPIVFQLDELETSHRH